ncbi:MAG: methyltransferase domain-containing protein [Tepidiformaceae bacterium]
MVATIFEAVHDLADPVRVLRAVHRALKPDGVLLIADENVGDTFTAPAENLDGFLYAARCSFACRQGWRRSPRMRPGRLCVRSAGGRLRGCGTGGD